MKTRAEFAAYIEIGDFVAHGDEQAARVIHVDDTTDHIILCVENEDGERWDMVHGPFESILIVETFEDEDDEEVDTDLEL